MKHKTTNGAHFGAELKAFNDTDFSTKFRNTYKFECYDKDGNLKWEEVVPNIVVNTGLADVQNKYFLGSTYTATHYVGLVDSSAFSAFAAGDTMASHSGWVEVSAGVYSEATREVLTVVSSNSGSTDNSASKASFSILATASINGAFISTDNTKAGTAGILYGEASFSAARQVANGDTLNVTATLTAATA